MVRPMTQKLVDFLVSPVAVLGLHIKAENALKAAGISTVLHLVAHDGYELGKKAWDFGPKKRQAAETALLGHNLRLGIARDYRDQLAMLQEGDAQGLRDIAVCFTRDFKPAVRATKEDKDTLASTLLDPFKKKLMDAFTPAQLQNPAARTEIEKSLDLAIETARAKMGALKL